MALMPKKNKAATITKMVIGFLSAVLINPMVSYMLALKFVDKQGKIAGGSGFVQQRLPYIGIDDVPLCLGLVEDERSRRYIDYRRQPILIQRFLLQVSIRSGLYLHRRLLVVGDGIFDPTLGQHRLRLQLLADQSIFFLQTRGRVFLGDDLLVHPDGGG